MSYNSQLNRVAISSILRRGRAALSDVQYAKLEPFIKHYFANVAPDDLAALEPARAWRLAYDHWILADNPARGKPLLQTGDAENGAPYTFIDIVTGNMPFLVDSVRMELNRQGYIVNLMIHPVFEVERDRAGSLKNIMPPDPGENPGRRESFIHVEIDRATDAEKRAALEKGLLNVLRDVRRAVGDWRKMSGKLNTILEELENIVAPIPPRHMDEVRAFLRWLDEKSFTFLGYREYEIIKEDGQEKLSPVKGSTLGIMQDERFHAVDDARSRLFTGKRRAPAEEILLITKSLARSTVHRPAYLDYIAVRRFDRRGHVTGECRFLGLYTSIAYRRHPREVPVVREKIDTVFNRSGFDPLSHTGKAFLHILGTYPRDELLQIAEDDLFRIAMGILHLGERQRIKLFVREDSLRRFVFCLVYVPRDLYDSELRRRMSEIILAGFNGQDLTFNVRLGDESFARVEFFVRTDPDNFPRYDAGEIENAILKASRGWIDGLRDGLLKDCSAQECVRLLNRYSKAFPAAYMEDFPPEAGLADIGILESLGADENLKVNLYCARDGDLSTLRLKLYKSGPAVAPSDSLPVLENMGVRVLEEKPYRIHPEGADTELWIHDYSLSCRADNAGFATIKPVFEEIFGRAWRNSIENDGFNALGIAAGLQSREIALLRACCKYLLQAGLTFSQVYMEQCLLKHTGIAAQLVELFKQRFDPDKQKTDSADAASRLENKIALALDEIASLDEDRILRNFLAVIQATVRTNYYQSNGDDANKPCIAFKFDTSKVLELPEPRPMFEIFVYSPRVEGVHLRSGRVARGGLRWSDRREDFRTEVLGLVKAQKVKNAVIVPTGAKGGFVLKQPPVGGDRDALFQEGIACYKLFVSALLDITDNLKKGKIVPPPRVVRYDGDDPYLVVAADKGTATFSDYANELSAQYDFWLGDAFASGGSLGYDHKKMGITAKGAWESVKLLFRDLGKDIQKEDFTVVGIGDMAGDVFGNGMLLSKHIKLVGAFNHLHIFLDPDPDPAASFKERQRLFKLPRSNWTDYNAELISKGGGIYPRSAKSIPLSPQVQALLGCNKNSLKPNELIQCLLKAPVDLLWNGGIGTYIKASHEQHSDAGDRTNDVLRINGRELRCKVVGEGGNLGMTQKGRIEFALSGGRVDTDFIHNAGGVNCSDHEVNIKILLNPLKLSGRLREEQRNKLLSDMTDEVSALVLQSNYWQGLAITLIEADAPAKLDEHGRYLRHLETAGQLIRTLEGLPDDDTLLERKAAGLGLTRPEIAVLVSYTKLIAEDDLVQSDIWDDPFFAGELLRYFPTPLRKSYAKEIQTHPLRREILSMFVVNRMINRMGCTFIFGLQEETGATTAEIVRAYTIAWEVFGLRDFWSDVAALDNKVPASAQTAMMLESVRLIYRASKWLIRHRKRALDIRRAIDDFGKGADIVRKRLSPMLLASADPIIAGKLASYREQGIGDSLALSVVGMDAWYCTFDIVSIGGKMKLPVETVMDVYFTLSAYLDIYWLRVKIGEYRSDSHWQELARKSLVDDLYAVLRLLTAEVLRATDDNHAPRQRIDTWRERNRPAVDRCLRIPEDLKLVENLDLAMFSVSLRELQNLHQASMAN